MTAGVTSASAFCQRRVVVGPQVRVLLAKRGDLPLLEIGLGDDLAVHLHQDLLDDVGLRRRDGQRDHQPTADDDVSDVHVNL